MKFLIVHISDIHIESASDLVFDRISSIVEGIQPFSAGVDAVFLVVTGDITQRGSSLEYESGAAFLAHLKSNLEVGLDGLDVHVIAVPGNHDCDFSADQKARNLIVESVSNGSATLDDASILDLCVAPQDRFFKLEASLSPSWEPQYGSDRLAWLRSFELGTESLEFVCINSASTSTISENPGTLVVETRSLPATSKGSLRVALMHHPVNWLRPNDSRSLSRELGNRCDLVLTGHEHNGDMTVLTDSSSDSFYHIEGGALQSNGPESAFNVLVVDTAARRKKFACLEWHDGIYRLGARSIRGNDGGGLAWVPLTDGSFSGDNTWRISSEMSEYLSDPGANLSHGGTDRIRRSDIYAARTLRSISLGDERPTRMNEEGLTDVVVGDNNVILVSGDDGSGRSALTKSLFRRLHGRKLRPVLLHGTERLPTLPRLYDVLEQKYCEQYQGSLEELRQVASGERVVIIDDFDKRGLKRSKRQQFIDHCLEFCGSVILLVNQVWTDLGQLMTSQSTNCKMFELQPLSPRQREEIISRWHSLGTDLSPENLAREVAGSVRFIDNLIGHNFVPSQPVVVLAVLQARESATPMDTRSSTQGSFYETLINVALARGGKSADQDVTKGYLTFLAEKMFNAKQHALSLDDFRQVHEEYERWSDLSLSREKMLEKLSGMCLITIVDDWVQFRYRYVYYYFVAVSIARSIHEPATKLRVQKMAGSLYIREFAHTLLFLAHLTRDPCLVDALCDASKGLLQDEPIARLEEDVAFLDSQVVPARLVIVDTVEHEGTSRVDDEVGGDGRIRALERTGWSEEIGASDVLDPLARLNAGVKALQITGQVLRNYPGTLDGKTKTRLGQSCLDTGLRLTGMLHRLFRENEKNFKIEVSRIVMEREGISELDETVWARASQTMSSLVGMGTFGLLKRTSAALAGPDLGRIRERLIDVNSSTAARLVEVSVKLDSLGTFPEQKVNALNDELRGKEFSRRLLLQLVLQHFSMFPRDFRLKQRVSNTLEVSYQEVVHKHARSRVIKG